MKWAKIADKSHDFAEVIFQKNSLYAAGQLKKVEYPYA